LLQRQIIKQKTKIIKKKHGKYKKKGKENNEKEVLAFALKM